MYKESMLLLHFQIIIIFCVVSHHTKLCREGVSNEHTIRSFETDCIFSKPKRVFDWVFENLLNY